MRYADNEELDLEYRAILGLPSPEEEMLPEHNVWGKDERGKFTAATPTAWKPGHPGNPGGRKPGPSFRSAIKRALSKKCSTTKSATRAAQLFELDPETSDFFDLVAAAAIRHAFHGDSRFFSELINRVDGKVKEHVEVEMKDKVDLTERIAYWSSKLRGKDPTK